MHRYMGSCEVKSIMTLFNKRYVRRIKEFINRRLITKSNDWSSVLEDMPQAIQ